MSRKDYELIARVINEVAKDETATKLTRDATCKFLALKLAIEMKALNHGFNETKFVEACGFSL